MQLKYLISFFWSFFRKKLEIEVKNRIRIPYNNKWLTIMYVFITLFKHTPPSSFPDNQPVWSSLLHIHAARSTSSGYKSRISQKSPYDAAIRVPRLDLAIYFLILMIHEAHRMTLGWSTSPSLTYLTGLLFRIKCQPPWAPWKKRRIKNVLDWTQD